MDEELFFEQIRNNDLYLEIIGRGTADTTKVMPYVYSNNPIYDNYSFYYLIILLAILLIVCIVWRLRDNKNKLLTHGIIILSVLTEIHDIINNKIKLLEESINMNNHHDLDMINLQYNLPTDILIYLKFDKLMDIFYRYSSKDKKEDIAKNLFCLSHQINILSKLEFYLKSKNESSQNTIHFNEYQSLIQNIISNRESKMLLSIIEIHFYNILYNKLQLISSENDLKNIYYNMVFEYYNTQSDRILVTIDLLACCIKTSKINSTDYINAINIYKHSLTKLKNVISFLEKNFHP